MPDNANDWGRRLDAGETGDPELQLAARLRAARPPIQPLPSAVEAELRARVLASAAPRTEARANPFDALRRLNLGWWALTAASAVLLFFAAAVFYALAQPAPAALLSATQTPSSVNETPAVTVTPDFIATVQAAQPDQVQIISASPRDGALTGPLEVTVAYTLSTVPTATLRIDFVSPDWDGEFRVIENKAPWESGVETVISQLGYNQTNATVTLMVPAQSPDELRRLAREGRVALYAHLDQLDDRRNGSRLAFHIAREFTYSLPPADFPGDLTFGTYTVAAGDTCASIAAQFATTVADLVAANAAVLNADCSNLTIGQLLNIPLTTSADAVRVIAVFSPRGRYVARYASGTLKIWRTDRLAQPLYEFDWQGGLPLMAFRAIPEEIDQFAAVGADGKLHLWDLSTGEQRVRRAAEIAPSGFTALAFSFRESRLYLIGHSIFELDHQSLTLNSLTPRSSPAPAASAAFSPDGTQLAIGRQDGGVEVWDWLKRRLSDEFAASSSAVRQIAFSPDNRRLYVSDWDGGALSNLSAWEIADNQLRYELTSEAGAVFALSPDGKLLATGNAAGQVNVWEAETGALRALLGQHAANLTALAFSADGRTIFSADETGEVKAWPAP